MPYNAGDKIDNAEILYRRVYRKIVKPNGVISSRAFAPRPKDNGQLSVNIASLTTYEDTIQDEAQFAIYQFAAQCPHDLGLDCIYDPIEGINLAHTVIIGFVEGDESIPAIIARAAIKVTPNH